mgnify:CR=1 FL=1
MGSLSEFNGRWRLFLKAYPWRRVDPVPWNPLQKPLRECRLALVTSAGFTAAGQIPFDAKIKGGDASFREIPGDVELGALREHHRSTIFDHRGMRADPNLVFPRDRVQELAARGRIGSVNHRHLSFMGSITAPGRLRAQSAPEAAALLKSDAVDVALLVPV